MTQTSSVFAGPYAFRQAPLPGNDTALGFAVQYCIRSVAVSADQTLVMSLGIAMPIAAYRLTFRLTLLGHIKCIKKKPNNLLLTLKGLDNWASNMHDMRGGGGIPESERTTGFT